MRTYNINGSLAQQKLLLWNKSIDRNSIALVSVKVELDSEITPPLNHLIK